MVAQVVGATTHHSSGTGGSRAWRATTFVVAQLELALAMIIAAKRVEQAWQAGQAALFKCSMVWSYNS